MLAWIFERFGLIFGAKLGWKIHQILVPKGVEKKDAKKKRLEWASELEKVASWRVIERSERPRYTTGDVGVNRKRSLAPQGRPHFAKKNQFKEAR